MVTVSAVNFSAAAEVDRDRGLLGYVSFLVNGAIKVDGVTARRTRDGKLTLSYPARRDGTGRDHPYFRPITDEVRRSIESQVFAALLPEGAA